MLEYRLNTCVHATGDVIQIQNDLHGLEKTSAKNGMQINEDVNKVLY